MQSHIALIPPVHSEDSEFEKLLIEATEIGRGSSRAVYEIPGHPSHVVKVSLNSGNAANWVEAVIYWHVTDKTLFGSVASVSRSGKYLVMERLDDVPPGAAATSHVPIWWTDRKPDNLGISPQSGAIKLRDYALINLLPGNLVPMPSQAENEDMKRWLSLIR